METPPVTHPSDFSTTSVPTLSDLDRLLRCQVCKDVFRTPMITSCAHTFCSLCIRQCLSADGRCPTCRANDQPTKLRKNGVIQELVDAWGGTRASLLEALSVVRRDATDGNGRTREQAGRRSAKRERADDEEAQDGRSSRRLRSSRSNASYAEVPLELDDEAPRDSNPDADDDYNPDQSTSLPAPTTPSNLVSCPCCGAQMKVDLVYSHLDHCTGRPPATTTRTKPAPTTPAAPQPPPAPRPPPQYLPFLSYSLLNEKALRRKLADLGLPSSGPKPALQRRHEYYVNLFNANCDADAPRPARALLRDLDAWERSMAAGGSSGVQALAMRGEAAPLAGAEVMRKDFDGKRWADEHGGQFKDLVAQARARAKAAGAGVKKAPPENVAADAGDQATREAIPDSEDEGDAIPDFGDKGVAMPDLDEGRKGEFIASTPPEYGHIQRSD
jgi:E3 ubiquitin-protein ligase RAD18